MCKWRGQDWELGTKEPWWNRINTENRQLSATVCLGWRPAVGPAAGGGGARPSGRPTLSVSWAERSTFRWPRNMSCSANIASSATYGTRLAAAIGGGRGGVGAAEGRVHRGSHTSCGTGGQRETVAERRTAPSTRKRVWLGFVWGLGWPELCSKEKFRRSFSCGSRITHFHYSR